MAPEQQGPLCSQPRAPSQPQTAPHPPPATGGGGPPHHHYPPKHTPNLAGTPPSNTHPRAQTPLTWGEGGHPEVSPPPPHLGVTHPPQGHPQTQPPPPPTPRGGGIFGRVIFRVAGATRHPLNLAGAGEGDGGVPGVGGGQHPKSGPIGGPHPGRRGRGAVGSRGGTARPPGSGAWRDDGDSPPTLIPWGDGAE